MGRELGAEGEDGGAVVEVVEWREPPGVARAENGASPRPLVADLQREEVVHAAEGPLRLGVVLLASDLAESVEAVGRGKISAKALAESGVQTFYIPLFKCFPVKNFIGAVVFVPSQDIPVFQQSPHHVWNRQSFHSLALLHFVLGLFLNFKLLHSCCRSSRNLLLLLRWTRN